MAATLTFALVAILVASCGGGGGGGGQTGSGGGTDQQPEAPTSLRVYLKTYNTVELRWKDNSTNEDGFDVYQKGISEPVANARPNIGRSVVSGLRCGTDYEFEVRAHNAAGESYSDTVEATTKLCSISIVFTELCVLNDEDPVGAGEVWFWFRSGPSTGKRLPSSGTKSIESRQFNFNFDITDPLHFGEVSYQDYPNCFDPNLGFQFSIRYDEPIEIYVEGNEEDTSPDPDDSLGKVSRVYAGGEQWTFRSTQFSPQTDLSKGYPDAEQSSNEDFTVWWLVRVTGTD